MKKSLIISMILMSFALSIYSQAPYQFNYQAVARDASGEILKNTPVKIRISILQSNIAGSSVYSETHSLTTNSFGLINLKIGTGNNKTGLFEDISWGTDNYFLKIEMDKNAGTNFKLIGTSQLLSVPYSLFSGNGVQFNSNLVCDETTEGTIRYDFENKIMEFCDGESWTEFGSGNKPTTCGEDFTDPRDGQVYPTVQIGNQCWMAKNMNFGVYKESVYANSAEGHSDVSNNGIVEKYAYQNDTTNFAIYGGLYDWNEMMNYSANDGAQGICPDGWHIPSKEEFSELIETVGGANVAGKQLKTGGSSGFNFEMGGGRTFKGSFSPGGASSSGYIWFSTTDPSDNRRACHVSFSNGADNVLLYCAPFKVEGKSVRCIKN